MIPFLMKRSAEPAEFLKYPVVADGLLMANGMTVIAWRGKYRSVAFYACPEDMIAVHGHDRTLFTANEDRWELTLDPWHADAFVGTPGEGRIGNRGKQRAVFGLVDWCGNITGVLGPAVEVVAMLEQVGDEQQKFRAVEQFLARGAIVGLRTDPDDSGEPVKCGTFGAEIPPEVRERMDRDRAAAEAPSRHNHEGNCWNEVHSCDECGAGNMCDVCHKHHEPRGECDECPECEACTADERGDAS